MSNHQDHAAGTERVPLLTRAQVAAQLGVKESTVMAWEANGAGPPSVKLGHRTVRYPPNLLDEWLAERAAARAAVAAG